MKNILVATDFSKRSDAAVARGAALAKAQDATLTLAHIVDDDQSERLAAAAEAEAGVLLKVLSAGLDHEYGLAPETTVRRAEPHAGILDAAGKAGADLIVIGAHRRNLVRNTFVGTTAERTIRAGNIPVLVARRVDAEPYRSPCIALDFSENDLSPATLSIGLELFDRAAARLVFAFDVPGYRLMRQAGTTEREVRQYVQEVRRSVHPSVSQMADEAGLNRLRTVLKPAVFSTPGAILEACADENADLIVVGARRKKAFDRFRLGSVSEAILRRADVDVLVVPPAG